MFLTISIPFEKFQREKKVVIYLPEDYYKTKKRYPVLYINDGQNAFFDHQSFMGTSWGFDQYVKEHHLDIIMVAIPCVFDDAIRMDEYGPWLLDDYYSQLFTKDRLVGGQGDDYLHFVIDNVKVLIDHRFRTLPSFSAMVGSSMGGVISAYAFLAYPQVFKRVAALSTAFFLYEKQFLDLIAHYQGEGKLYFDLGDDEGHGNAQESEAYISSNTHIQSALEEKGIAYEYHFFAHTTHNEAAWRKRLPLFMPMLFEEDDHV